MTTDKREKSERPERIHQMVARELGTAILAGRHLPGELFDGEIQQAASMRVSRTAYREAMRILTAKGLIESKPKAGTKVAPRARWNILDPQLLEWMFSGEPDQAFVRDLFELRRVVEPAAVSFAAQRRSDAQLAEMRAALDVMKVEGLGNAQGQAADKQFHHLILESSNNAALQALGSSIGAAVKWTTHFKERRAQLPRDPYSQHLAVFDCIEREDAQGAHCAMTELIDKAYADMNFKA